MLRKWLTKKLSIHDDDPVVKEFRSKGYARRHTVDVDTFRMTSSLSPVTHSGSGGEELTDQEMMAAALAKHSKSYEDHHIHGGGPYRRHKSVTGPLSRAASPSSSVSAGLSSPTLQALTSGMVRRSPSAGLRPRLSTVPSTDCPSGAEGGSQNEGGKEEEEEEEEKEKEEGGRVEKVAKGPSAGQGTGERGSEGGGKGLEEAKAEGGAAEAKETRIDGEGGGEGDGGGGGGNGGEGGATIKVGGGGGTGGDGGGGGGARAKAGVGGAGGGGRGGEKSGGSRGRGSGSGQQQRIRKAGPSKAVGCLGSSSFSSSSCSGSIKRRSVRRGGMARPPQPNGLRVDASQPLVFPTTPETILEYHKQRPMLDENEEWLVVELNEFECLVDSIDVIRIIAKHSKFFEVSPDELWEEFFEFVDTVPSYDEVINFDVWQEFRDKKYTC